MVTCRCPLRGAGSPEPLVTPAPSPGSGASAWTASKMRLRSGCSSQPSSTPSTSRPRITTCSTSSTDSGCPARAPNNLEVTPGRSRPVSVMSSEVRGVFIAGARLPELPLESGQQQVNVAELVPQVPGVDRGLVAAAQQIRPGERGQHLQVRGARLVQPGEQPVHRPDPGLG